MVEESYGTSAADEPSWAQASTGRLLARLALVWALTVAVILASAAAGAWTGG